MSLKKFSELFSDLDSINSSNNKIEVLKSYFLSLEVVLFLSNNVITSAESPTFK